MNMETKYIEQAVMMEINNARWFPENPAFKNNTGFTKLPVCEYKHFKLITASETYILKVAYDYREQVYYWLDLSKPISVGVGTFKLLCTLQQVKNMNIEQIYPR